MYLVECFCVKPKEEWVKVYTYESCDKKAPELVCKFPEANLSGAFVAINKYSDGSLNNV